MSHLVACDLCLALLTRVSTCKKAVRTHRCRALGPSGVPSETLLRSPGRKAARKKQKRPAAEAVQSEDPNLAVTQSENWYSARASQDAMIMPMPDRKPWYCRSRKHARSHRRATQSLLSCSLNYVGQRARVLPDVLLVFLQHARRAWIESVHLFAPSSGIAAGHSSKVKTCLLLKPPFEDHIGLV